jgi:hypothetical protein
MKLIGDNKILLQLPKRLEHNSVYDFAILDYDYQFLIIDFSETTSVSLSGVMYIICLSGYLKNRAKSSINQEGYCEIINLKPFLQKILMNFGFFLQMTNTGNLIRVNNVDIIINKSLLETEKRYVNHQLLKINSDHDEPNIVMPITTIVAADKKYFEYYIAEFMSKFSKFYRRLIELDFFSVSSYNKDNNENFSDFSKAIFEIAKNIFDHSSSWGIGAIHAREKGIEIAYYDVGLGIAKSMRTNKMYSEKTDLEAIYLAFNDGVSSKIENGDNKGRGFTKMLEFAKKRNGFLSVRTDKYHFINGKLKNTNWFPGTQIVIFVSN